MVGDRYAGRPAHRDASVTVLAVEALEAVAAEHGAAPFDPHARRRTVVLRDAEVEAHPVRPLRPRGPHDTPPSGKSPAP